MTRDIALVGAGVKAPGGNSPAALWNSLCAGSSTARPFHDERLPAGTAVLASRVEGFDPADYLLPAERRRVDRTVELAIAAAQDAMDAVDGDDRPETSRCAIVCGVGFGASAGYEEQHVRLASGGLRNMSPLSVALLMPSAAAAQLSLRFGFTGPALTVSAACASGAIAIGEGMELLRRGAVDLVLAGGVDAMITYSTLCAFLKLDVMSRAVDDPRHASRPFDSDRDGFVLGEGAAFVVLQRLDDAISQSRRVVARLVGYAAGSDSFHLVAPQPDGDGALRCMRAALTDAGLPTTAVGHVSAHATGTQVGDLAEGRALNRLLHDRAVPVTAVKGTTGHLIGGSGAVEAVVAAHSCTAGVVPPVAGLRELDPRIELDVVRDGPRSIGAHAALSTSFGFGGANACLVLAPP